VADERPSVLAPLVARVLAAPVDVLVVVADAIESHLLLTVLRRALPDARSRDAFRLTLPNGSSIRVLRCSDPSPTLALAGLALDHVLVLTHPRGQVLEEIWRRLLCRGGSLEFDLMRLDRAWFEAESARLNQRDDRLVALRYAMFEALDRRR
jgi:hypothetical protein